MPRYFFDTRDDGKFWHDDLGLELPGIDAVRAQAAESLAELARDVLPSSVRREMSVEARDELRPVLTAVLFFEAEILAA